MRTTLKVLMVALTATAAPSTRRRLVKHLGLASPVSILLSHDWPNVYLAVKKMTESIEETLVPFVEELRNVGKLMPRTIIYCRTISLC